MQIHGIISQFPKEVKGLILAFIICLSIGFYAGIRFVNDTSNSNPDGIEERYLGNESDEAATVMKFKKSSQEVMTMVHNHILSLSVIFFLLGGLIAITGINKKLKSFLMIEPFVSILCTFGGIYFMWSGMLWMKYVIMVSGVLMTVSFTLSIFFILKGIFSKK
jgi:cellulose synthase/poly-beta-1,6-N-acetylglucosamine synthase-like glycosyltransferase